MKGVDAGVLRMILEGDPAAKDLLKRWRGSEVATTEVAMLELAAAAVEGPARTHAGRRAALDRLRRKVTVLPVDRRAVREAALRMVHPIRGTELLRFAEWGTLEGAGCEEMFTRGGPPHGKWRLRCVKIRPGHHKTRK